MNYQIFFPLLDKYAGPVLVGLFVALLFIEWKWPLRRWTGRFLRRTLTNAAVAVPTFVVLRLALIPAVIAAAYWAQQANFGLLHWLDIPGVIAAIVGFLWLDYALYVWHWLNHRIPFLWRFHNVHHTDLDLSVTTAIRFHFGEMLISAFFRAAAVMLMGVSPLVVLVYEIAFEASVAFHHSNWRLPFRLERMLTTFLVTPRMHGIHHSVVRRETDSNYSNMLNIWDRLHRTLRLNVHQDEITIGVPGYRAPEDHSVSNLLLSPFRNQKPYWVNADGSTPDRTDSGDKRLLKPDQPNP